MRHLCVIYASFCPCVFRVASPLFQAQESGTFAFLPQLQTVTLQLYLVHCDDTSKRVVSTDMEPMVEMLLNEEEVVTACLGPDKRECTIPFRVNILSGKRLFRLAIEPHAPDALTKDGSLLIAGYTTPFRVVTKATTKKPKVDAGVAGVAGVSGVSGVSGVAGMAAKRKREDASPTSLTSMSSPRVKRARGEEESEESEVESGDEPEEEDLRGTVASIARNVHHMLKMVSVVAQQQAGLARIVTDHLALVSAPVSAPAAVAAVVAVKT